MEQLALGRAEVSLSIGARDELGHLAEKFNHLSQRIRYDRKQWENERGQLFNIFRSITDAVVLLDASGMVLFANAEAQTRLALPAAGTQAISARTPDSPFNTGSPQPIRWC